MLLEICSSPHAPSRCLRESMGSPRAAAAATKGSMHVDSSKWIKQGVLSKRSVSAKFVKNWKDRVITVMQDRVIWQEEGSDRVLGQLLLGSNASIELNSDSDSRFSIMAGDKKLELQCSSATEAKKWVETFQQELGLDVRNPNTDLHLDFSEEI